MDYIYEISRLNARIEELEKIIGKLEIKSEQTVHYGDNIRIGIPESDFQKFPNDPMIMRMVPSIIKKNDER